MQLAAVTLRKFIQKRVDLLGLRKARWIARDPYANDPPESSCDSEYPYTLGIIKEFWHAHWPYIGACRELGVAYKVLDLSGPDWLTVVERSGCDAFLVWPSVQLSVWKRMFDERLRIMSEDLNCVLFPDYGALWLYESKRRMHYWLEGHGVPHAKTWVFYDLEEALAFADRVDLPIVYKTDLGSGASGVIIFRRRRALKRHIKRCFRKGFTTYRRCRNDKEWSVVLLQEYIADASEWRMIRIGDSFFGYEKAKAGDFHSGSHRWRYGRPPSGLLDLTKSITDENDFLSMDLDIFVAPDGRYLVNELQALFGMGNPYEMCVVDGKRGRMRYAGPGVGWQFEEGSFCQNYLCNLRVRALLQKLDARAACLTGIA
ncbi:MAG: hypothetical protein JSW27_18915 [Phycisphaerales bacterium]|nr:MAG: hypothetical protein JSW27_18915 [Phycisphaerales bacterium]